MKKKNLFFSAVMATAIVAMTACGSGGFSPKEVKLATETDSLNYLFGTWNGMQIKQREFPTDSDTKVLAEFIKGVDKEYRGSKGKSEVYNQAYAFGQAVKQIQENGFANDPNYKLDVNMLKQGFINAFRNYKDSTLTAGSAQGYIMRVANKIQQAQYMEQMLKQQQMQEQMQSQLPDSAKAGNNK
ncbi:MAG: hypothetical protein FWF72_04900 [Paludibacter sp.]|nr:hypothetical protein [Paludibacter sp.]